MKGNYCKNYILASFFIVLLITTIDFTSIQSTSLGTESKLPDPLSPDMILETSIFRRGSMRDFSTEKITDEELSTILWAAYGYNTDGTRTISEINETFGIHLYVLMKNETFFDVFTYYPENHSLIYVKQYRSFQFGQYPAPVYIGIVWDTMITNNAEEVGLVIGQVGQNIQLMTNALNLGSVINIDTYAYGYNTYSLSKIGLPANEIPMIIIPLGRPTNEYNFKYRPWYFSPLPRIKVSETSLTTALKQRQGSPSFEGSLTIQEQNQMVWSSYGYSYYLDRTEQDFTYQIYRHRTTPSAHGLYPSDMYAITEAGIYKYYPNILPPLIEQSSVDFVGLPIVSYYQQITKGDHREIIAEACGQPQVKTAPLVIIPILEHARTREDDPLWLWYYEIGSGAQNIFLEAVAWNMKTNLYPVNDPSMITSLLNLDEEAFLPMLVIPVGN